MGKNEGHVTIMKEIAKGEDSPGEREGEREKQQFIEEQVRVGEESQRQVSNVWFHSEVGQRRSKDIVLQRGGGRQK